MNVAFKRIRAYARGIVILIVFLAICLVLFKNRRHEVPFWFFGLTDDTRPINVVSLIIGTASTTLISWRVGALGWRVWRDLRDAKKENSRLTRHPQGEGEAE